MITNSTSLTAAIATGSSDVNATPVAAVGDIQDSDNWGGAELLPFTVKQADPFEDVDPPSFTPCQGNCEHDSASMRTRRCQSIAAQTRASVCVSDIDAQRHAHAGQRHLCHRRRQFQRRRAGRRQLHRLHDHPDQQRHATDADDRQGRHQRRRRDQHERADHGHLRRTSCSTRTAAPRMSDTIVNKINGNSDSMFAGAFYFPNQQLQINGTAGLDFNCAQFVVVRRRIRRQRQPSTTPARRLRRR